MKQNILSEIKLLLAAEERPVIFLATKDEAGNPRVRPVSLMSTPRGFYIGTSRKSRKAAEIIEHNCIEWVTLFPTDLGTGYLRLAGRAQEIDGEEKRQAVSETGYPVDEYWDGVSDPDFVVFRIQPNRVEYIRPGENDALDVTETFAPYGKC
jgi:general stress protein 26